MDSLSQRKVRVQPKIGSRIFLFNFTFAVQVVRMVPDEPKPEQSESSTAKRPRRRSRRGGRRHSRRRADQSPEAEPATPGAAVETGKPSETPEPAGTLEESEPITAPAHTSPVSIETEEREPIRPRQSHPSEERRQREPEPRTSAIASAVEEANKVVEELKRALDEMEEVLELLELAERQKIDDEREIEELKRALRRLHRPREGERH
jgi:hypothetical protein